MKDRADSRARHRAYAELAKLFPEAFKTLLNREREAEGLPALKVIKRGRPAKVNTE